MNTKNKNGTTANYLTWLPEDKFIANMSVQDNKKTFQKLLNMSDEFFSGQMANMVCNIQPLTSGETNGLIASVTSGDRIRIAYHISKVLQRHMDAVEDTHASDSEVSTFGDPSTKETYNNLVKVFGDKTFSIKTEEELSEEDKLFKENYPNGVGI